MFERRLRFVWLVLCAITVVSLIVGSLGGRSALEPSAAVASIAIAIALVKVRIIFWEFMEVRHAPVLLRRLTDAWVLLTGLCLLGTYFAGAVFGAG